LLEIPIIPVMLQDPREATNNVQLHIADIFRLNAYKTQNVSNPLQEYLFKELLESIKIPISGLQK
jgi:hypothetical protein